MRLLAALLVLCLALGASARAQDAVLTGRVADARGVALEGVSVFVPGTLSATFTLGDGMYRLDDVPVGAVAVRFSLAGYRPQTATVTAAAGEVRTLDVVLERQPFWERALLFSTDPEAEAGAHFSPERVRDAGDLPARSVGEAAGLLPGVARDERSDTLAFMGGTAVARTLDGVPLPAPLALPWPGVAQVAFYGEHTPASLAGGRDGLLALTTRDGSAARQFYVEGLASPFSAAGLTEVRGALGGPLLGNRARLFVAGSAARQDDFAPAAVPVWQVRESVLERLLASPQEIVIDRPGDPSDVRYLPLPVGLPDTVALTALGIPAGYRFAGLRNATEALTPADFKKSWLRRGPEAETRRLLARAGASLAAFDFSLTYAAASDARDVWNRSQALFRSEAFGRTETRQRYLRGDIGRTFGPFALRFTLSTYRDRSTTFDPRFPNRIAETLAYGNLSEPANATAAAYRLYLAEGNRLVPLYRDGTLPSQAGVAGLFALPGAAGTGFDRAEMDAAFLRLEQTARLRGHALTMGVEQQQQALRRITIAEAAALARFEVGRYEDLPPGGVESRYYGYDDLGLDRADSESLEAFARRGGCAATNLQPCRDATRIAPLEKTRTGLYAEDRFGLGPLRLDVGVRYDFFSHNRRVPEDPYALVPIVRVRDLDARAPTVAGSHAVYFSGQEIVGYRSREGRFFSPTGQEVPAADVVNRGKVRLAPGAVPGVLDEAAFQDAPTRGVLQPRAALRLAVAPQAAAWLSYNRTASLPADDRLNATLGDYAQRLQSAGFLPNAGLRPEVATTYAVGAEVAFGRARLDLSAAQRQIDYMAVPFARKNVFPGNYTTFVSDGQVRVRSVSAVLRVARTSGLALEASYTLGHSTGSAALGGNIYWLREPGFAPFDATRSAPHHVLGGVLDYRTGAGEGPRLGRMALLEGLHALLALEARSGARYTALQNPYPIGVPTPPVGVAGRIGGEALPWTVLVHVHAERAVPVRGRTVTLFAQARNLLDARNLRAVYASTGRPDDDGYLDTEAGRSNYPADSIGRFYYQARLQNPDHYGLPREVRLGLRLAL